MHDLPDPDWYLDHVVLPSGIEQYKVGPVRAWQASWAALALQLRGSVDESPVGAAIELALDQGFVLTRAQTMRCGVTDAELRRLVRSGDWTRCGHGCFATVRASAEDDEHDAARRRHAVAAAAAALRRRRHTIGGASAVILHGLPVFDIPDRPQLITDVRGNTGPRQAVDVRVARLAPDERDDWYGVPCAALVRAVVDLLRMDPRSGLMAADAALHEGLVRQQELTSGVERAATKPGIRRPARSWSSRHRSSNHRSSRSLTSRCTTPVSHRPSCSVRSKAPTASATASTSAGPISASFSKPTAAGNIARTCSGARRRARSR
jgi:hypothetical protein